MAAVAATVRGYGGCLRNLCIGRVGPGGSEKRSAAARGSANRKAQLRGAQPIGARRGAGSANGSARRAQARSGAGAALREVREGPGGLGGAWGARNGSGKARDGAWGLEMGLRDHKLGRGTAPGREWRGCGPWLGWSRIGVRGVSNRGLGRVRPGLGWVWCWGLGWARTAVWGGSGPGSGC